MRCNKTRFNVNVLTRHMNATWTNFFRSQWWEVLAGIIVGWYSAWYGVYFIMYILVEVLGVK